MMPLKVNKQPQEARMSQILSKAGRQAAKTMAQVTF